MVDGTRKMKDGEIVEVGFVDDLPVSLEGKGPSEFASPSRFSEEEIEEMNSAIEKDDGEGGSAECEQPKKRPSRPISLKVKVKKIHPNAILPSEVSKEHDSFDLFALCHGTRAIAPNKTAAVGVGVAMAIPEGHEARLSLGRSLARQDVVLLDVMGLLRGDLRGQVTLLLRNIGRNVVEIADGDSIARLVIFPVQAVVFEVTDGAL